MKKWTRITSLVLILILTSYLLVHFYPFIFAKTVSGEVVGIERVSQNMTILGTGEPIPSSQLFSFAVAIKALDGQITTGSSEDRQWAVVQKGQCAEAKFFPYPPWDLDKAGTYSGARLLRLYTCP